MFRKLVLNVRANKLECLVGAIIILLALIYAIQNVSSTELWTYLKAGEWIIQHHSVPHQDIFSYTFYGKLWLDPEWFFHALIYLIYHVLQFQGLVVFQAVIVMLILFVLYKNGTLFDRGERWITFLILVLVLTVMRPQTVLRPQIFLLLFLGIYIYVLNLYYSFNKNYLYLLPIFQFFWTNIHGSFVLGIILAGLYFLISTAQLLWAHRNKINPVFKNKRFILPFAILILLIIVSLVNPYGYKIYDIPLKTVLATETKGFIEEWSPIPLKSLFIFSGDILLWFKVFFFLTLFSFIFCKKNLKKVEHIALFILFSIVAFLHQRFASVFGVAMGQVVIFNMSNILEHKSLRKAFKHTWKWSYVIVVLLLLFFLVGLQGGYKNIELRVRKGYYPEGVVQFIKEHGIQGNIFNSFDYGGFLIWHLYPQLKVFIDGRAETVYSEDFFWLHRQGLENERVWKRLVYEYDIDMVLIDDKRDIGYRLFVKHLDDDPSWSLVAFDDVSVLYLKDKPKFKEIITRYKFKYFRPGDIGLGYATSKNYTQKLIQELIYKEEQYSSNFYACLSLALAYLSLDEPAQLEKASVYFRKALAIQPNNQFGRFNLGITLMRLKRFEEAITELGETTTAYPNAYYYMGICYYEKGDFYQAIKFFTKYKKIFRDETTKDAYEYLGLSYVNTFQLKEAVSCFLRARYLSEPSFEINRNLGFAYFGLKDFAAASQYFEEALDLKPNDINILYNLGVCYEKMGRPKEALGFFKSVIRFTPQTAGDKNLIERAKRKLEK
jgi:tetratricopeptide (TPR) repeat protein